MLYVTFASGPDRGSPPKKELNIEDMKHETLMNFASRAEGQFAQFEVRTWTLNRFPRNFVPPPSGDGHVDTRRPTWLVYWLCRS